MIDCVARQFKFHECLKVGGGDVLCGPCCRSLGTDQGPGDDHEHTFVVSLAAASDYDECNKFRHAAGHPALRGAFEHVIHQPVKKGDP